MRCSAAEQAEVRTFVWATLRQAFIDYQAEISKLTLNQIRTCWAWSIADVDHIGALDTLRGNVVVKP